MSRKPSPKNYDENPEWTKADFAKAKRPQDVLSPATLKNFRGPQKEPTKVPVSIRLNQEVVNHFKALGAGWQTKIDEVLTLYATREGALRAAKPKAKRRSDEMIAHGKSGKITERRSSSRNRKTG